MKQKRLTDLQKIELVELFKQGKSSKELSAYFGITDVAIRVLLKHRGFKYDMSKSCQRFDINEDYFDNINSQDKAYFLGFLYADGCNKRPRNIVTLILKEDDREILEQLNKLIFPDKELIFEKDYRNNHSNKYGIRISNKHISLKLEELGIVKAKTHKIVFPLWLSKDLYPHFIRGYFDGDGYIGTITNSKGHFKDKVSIVGTELFVNSLINIFKEELNINCSIETRHPERNHNIRTITISGRLQVIKLMDYLYNNSNLKLKRKHDRYKQIKTRYK